MTPVNEKRFRRLLRWYPRSWRDANASVLLAIMLESAEHDGRSGPTPGETVSAVVHGTAARVNRRFAIATSLAALVGAAVAGVLGAWGAASGTLPVLLAGVIPLFAGWALVAVLRERGLLGDGRALVTLGAIALGLVLNTLTVFSWSLGFDAADAGLPPTGLAAVWAPLLIAAEIAGAFAIALIVDAIFRRTSIPPAARALIAGVIGLAIAPMIGLGLLSIAFATSLTLGAVVLAFLPSRRARRVPVPEAPEAPHAPTGSDSPSIRQRSTARLLAWTAGGGGIVGAVYALTGSHWSPGAVDATIAMGQGISVMLVSGIPLLAALGVASRNAPSRGAHVHVWTPLALVALGLGCITVGYLGAPSWVAMSPWFQASAVLIGSAIGWWIISRVRLPRAAVLAIGIGSGVLYASFFGVMIAPMLAFAVPTVALILACRPVRPKGATSLDRIQTAHAEDAPFGLATEAESFDRGRIGHTRSALTCD